jgi:hypothetical protein
MFPGFDGARLVDFHASVSLEERRAEEIPARVPSQGSRSVEPRSSAVNPAVDALIQAMSGFVIRMALAEP